MWARNFLEELGFPQTEPTTLCEDNMSTITLLNNGCNSIKTKHVALPFHFTQEQIHNGVIRIEHLPTTQMTSDILTKPLPPSLFIPLREKLLGILVRTHIHLLSILDLGGMLD